MGGWSECAGRETDEREGMKGIFEYYLLYMLIVFLYMLIVSIAHLPIYIARKVIQR